MSRFLSLLLLSTLAWAGPREDGLRALSDKNYEEAVKLLGQARSEAPADAEVGQALATALYRTGQFRAAEQLFDALAEAAPTPEEAARARYNAGMSAYRGGRLDEALDDMQAAMAKDQRFADAQKNATALQKEIDARRKKQSEQEQPQEGQEQGEQPEQGEQGQSGEAGQPSGEQGEQGEQQGEAGEQGEQGEQGNGKAPDGGDGQRPEEGQAPSGERGEGEMTGQGEPGESEAGEGGEEGLAVDEGAPGEMSAEAATRLVEGVPDGKPRVVVGKGSGEKDW